MPPPDEGAEGSGLTLAQLWHYYRRYPYVLARIALAAVVIGGIYVVLQSVESVLFPILLSLLIAYLLDPTIDRLEERGMSRTTAILLFLGAGALAVVVFVVVLYPTIGRQLSRLGQVVPNLLDIFNTKTLPWIEATLAVEVPDTLSAAVAEYGETLRVQIPTLATGATGWLAGLWSRTGAIVASLLNLVMIPVFTFYFLRDFDRMRLILVDYIPVPQRDFVLSRIRLMDEVVGAWFRGQVEVAGILAVLYAIGLAIVFGFAGVGITGGIAVGVLTGLLNIIPYFGFLIGFVLSLSMVVIDWHGWMPVAGVLVVFAGVQGLEGYVITPRIVGEKVGLSPVVVIIVLLLGGEVLGLLGILLAIPVAGIIRVLLPDITKLYLQSNFYTGALEAGRTPPEEPDPAPAEE